MVKSPDTRRTPGDSAGRQRGLALVALLALMTLLMIAAMAAAPSLRHQAKRERELEAIARGEEVAEAIRAFVHHTNRLPTSMDELKDGAPRGTKKIQVLRASAACDPLTSREGECGEWRLIKATDPALVTFVVSLGKYANGRVPETKDDRLKALASQLPRPAAILDTGTSRDAPCDDFGSSSSGQFIGVASRSCADSVIAYYGIEQHAGWVFTPFYR
jgi:type II secretory pathway pseudopilin PulG